MCTGQRRTFAAVVVVIALLALLVLLDLPAKPFKEELPGELAERPNLSIYAPNPKELADVDFTSGAPYITVGTRLPVWPRRHAPLIGTITFKGVKRSAGPVKVVVHLPPRSTLTLSHDYEGEQENTENTVTITSLEPTPFREWLVRFTTQAPCGGFFGVVRFTIKSDELAYAQGWGRQRLTIPYASLRGKDVVEVVDDGSPEPCEQGSQSVQAPGVLALTTNERYQRVSEAAASSEQTRGIHAWALPRGEANSLVVEATIENTLVRYVADLAPDLLFLVVGAVLGAVLSTDSFRSGRRSRSGEEP